MKHAVILGSVILLLGGAAVAAAPQGVAAKARAIHQQGLVFDAHCDTALRILRDRLNLGVRGTDGHIDIPRMEEGGVKAEVFALWVEPSFAPDHAIRRTLEMADSVLSEVGRHPDKLLLALSAADVKQALAQKKIAVFLGIEGGHAIEDSLAALRMFHRLGVRLMTLTWMNNNHWADAAGAEPKLGGLSDLGKQVVREMNRLGMVVDVSHVSDQTFFDTLQVSTRPVIASHSGCRAVSDHYRNLTDDMLRALARQGGVLGINFYNGFLDAAVGRKLEETWKQLQPKIDALKGKLGSDSAEFQKQRKEIVSTAMKGIPKVSLDQLIRHIDHAVKVAGIDHVGLGSDFDGIGAAPVGLSDVAKLPLITEKLLERGYSEADIRKILGENMLRAFEAALERDRA